MYAVEYETYMGNGIVQLPEKYTSLQSTDTKIIILAKKMANKTALYPSIFFGLAHVSKKEINADLGASKNEWQQVSALLDTNILIYDFNGLIDDEEMDSSLSSYRYHPKFLKWCLMRPYLYLMNLYVTDEEIKYISDHL